MKKFSQLKRWIKFQWQKFFQGFSDEETWNLDYRLAKHILPRLRRFKKVSRAHPSIMTSEEWDVVLDKMIFSFELIARGNFSSLEIGDDPRIQEGLDLFGKYFQALWW